MFEGRFGWWFSDLGKPSDHSPDILFVPLVHLQKKIIDFYTQPQQCMKAATDFAHVYYN